MRKIRILIADDHGIVRAGIRSLLADHADVVVVGEAGSGWEAIVQATRLEPDIVLMDIAMDDLSGLEAAEEIKQRVPHVGILALTMLDREEICFAMLKAGALGYVLKGSGPDELLSAIRAVYHGEAYLSPAVTKSVLRDYLTQGTEQTRSRYDRLTLREKEVLHLMAEGKTTREMAEMLNLSVKTIEKYRSKVMHSLELHNLAELIKYAIRKGLIDVDDF